MKMIHTVICELK